MKTLTLKILIAIVMVVGTVACTTYDDPQPSKERKHRDSTIVSPKPRSR